MDISEAAIATCMVSARLIISSFRFVIERKPREVYSFNHYLIMGKILEKIFHKCLYPILESRNTIPGHRYSFRSLHSTVLHCHQVVDMIASSPSPITSFLNHTYYLRSYLTQFLVLNPSHASGCTPRQYTISNPILSVHC